MCLGVPSELKDCLMCRLEGIGLSDNGARALAGLAAVLPGLVVLRELRCALLHCSALRFTGLRPRMVLLLIWPAIPGWMVALAPRQKVPSVRAAISSSRCEIAFHDDTVPALEHLKRVGLEAWIGYFTKHLPANMESIKALRATTAADVRRMGTKGNMVEL